MAKKPNPGTAAPKKKRVAAKAKPARAAASARPKKSASARAKKGDFNAADALFKLIESPLVADLLAVGATAALAAIAESRHRGKSGGDAKSTRAFKAAGKAAAAAMGRRLATEFDEIRKASKQPKAGGAK